MLLGFWEKVCVDKISVKTSDDYRDWRIGRLKRKTSGTRTVDLELCTLNNAFLFAERKETVRHDPLANRPRYHDKKKVRHCREFMPEDANELHERVAPLFGRSQSVVLGYQYLVEAYTGLRPSHVHPTAQAFAVSNRNRGPTVATTDRTECRICLRFLMRVF